jgi:hypothetical protein
MTGIVGGKVTGIVGCRLGRSGAAMATVADSLGSHGAVMLAFSCQPSAFSIARPAAWNTVGRRHDSLAQGRADAGLMLG